MGVALTARRRAPADAHLVGRPCKTQERAYAPPTGNPDHARLRGSTGLRQCAFGSMVTTSTELVHGGDTPNLLVIITAGRSGSTLLKTLLDAHDAVAAPAEVGIPAVVARLLRAWATIAPWDHPGKEPQGLGDPTDGRAITSLPPSDVVTEVRAAALALMRRFCMREGKAIYGA